MWDAWAARPDASGYVFKEKLDVAPCDVRRRPQRGDQLRAYRVLTARFIKAVGADKSLSESPT